MKKTLIMLVMAVLLMPGGRVFAQEHEYIDLFLPAAGYRMSDKVEYVGSDGKYWSSSVYTDYPDLVWSFYFDSINYGTDLYEKTSGFTVRLVRSTR